MKSAITLALFPEASNGPFILCDQLARGFERAAQFGFDGIELFPDSAGDLNPAAVQGLCDKYAMKVAAVGTGAGWVKHKLRLTDPDPARRKQAQDFVAAIVEVAGKLGAPAIVGSMQGRWDDAVSRAQAIAWLTEALDAIASRAESYGVPLLYEFLNRYETNIFNRVAESLEFIGSLKTKNVKLLCDLFHMNIEEADIAAGLRAAGSKVGHIHFADSNRQAIGLGHTEVEPIAKALREIGYKGYLSAEVFP